MDGREHRGGEKEARDPENICRFGGDDMSEFQPSRPLATSGTTKVQAGMEPRCDADIDPSGSRTRGQCARERRGRQMAVFLARRGGWKRPQL
jgi:hypothetical protein